MRVFRRVLGLQQTVLEGVELDGDRDVVVARVRPVAGAARRCGKCGRACPRYDAGAGRRRWRCLDHGTTAVYLEAPAPRVSCPRHGPTVIAVPWARHGAGHTRQFDAQVAWLAVRTSKSAVTQLMRIAWRTVGSIVARVWAETGGAADRLAGLARIGIDEISYKKGHKYLTVVVDHDTGHLVWAAAGRDKATLHRFFDQLGPARSALLTHVFADAAEWIARVVAARAPTAVRCADPFHVITWANQALDQVRRQAWNTATGRHHGGKHGSTGPARTLKRARWALWKNPENLTTHQREHLAWIAKTDPRLHRAYLLKEGLRHVFTLTGQLAHDALDRWLSWARRSRIPAFVDLTRRITRYRDPIDNTLDHGLSNGLLEATNTKIRLLTRIAFGFHSATALIALAMLSLGGHPPHLPGR
jgi:transposase